MLIKDFNSTFCFSKEITLYTFLAIITKSKFFIWVGIGWKIDLIWLIILLHKTEPLKNFIDVDIPILVFCSEFFLNLIIKWSECEEVGGQALLGRQEIYSTHNYWYSNFC